MSIISLYRGRPVSEQQIEIVERKGLGHPDTMCDSIMEAVSTALAREYLERFGAVLHYNIDKGLLSAGSVHKTFGGGRVLKPMQLFIGDRATFSFEGIKVDATNIALNTAREWISKNMRHIDPVRHIRCHVLMGPGSAELSDIFMRPGAVRPANDTSAAVGYYPLSRTELIVLELEQRLNSREFKRRHPETGADIKVMGLRNGRRLDLTVAMPLLCSYIKSEKEYFERKEAILKQMQSFTRNFEGFDGIRVHFNTLDEGGRGVAGVYLSLLGTSAEDADSGQVGRGNRVNGIISMNRPMGTEAAAGKNGVSHVGKIYNVLSHVIAKDIYENIEGVQEVYVFLLSRIGTPIDRPQVAAAQILPAKGRTLRDVKKKAEEIFERHFANIGRFCLDLLKGRYRIC